MFVPQACSPASALTPLEHRGARRRRLWGGGRLAGHSSRTGAWWRRRSGGGCDGRDAARERHASAPRERRHHELLSCPSCLRAVGAFGGAVVVGSTPAGVLHCRSRALVGVTHDEGASRPGGRAEHNWRPGDDSRSRCSPAERMAAGECAGVQAHACRPSCFAAAALHAAPPSRPRPPGGDQRLFAPTRHCLAAVSCRTTARKASQCGEGEAPSRPPSLRQACPQPLAHSDRQPWPARHQAAPRRAR